MITIVFNLYICLKYTQIHVKINKYTDLFSIRRSIANSASMFYYNVRKHTFNVIYKMFLYLSKDISIKNCKVSASLANASKKDTEKHCKYI